MKFLRFLIFALIAGLMLSSCQKEYSYEGGNAHGSLKSDVGGDCFPVIIHGNFKKDSIIKDTNYAQIQLNITQTGTYFIKTDTVNGYSFSAAGIASVTGTNTIRLRASGKPIIQGVDVFTVKFDTTECEFNVTVTGTSGGAAAVFTLSGTPGTCTGAAQTTNFYAAIPTTPANTVTVNADVTVAGTYSITATTTPANGLTFTGTGTLAVGANQAIVLVADGGAPSTAGSIPYTLTTTSPVSNCGFNLTVQATPPPASFMFDCSTPVYTGTYEANTPTTGGTVVISVTSAAGGSYTITSALTSSNNGVTFMGSGVLPASPTPQQVTLYASGTPAAAGTFTYTLSSTGATGTCTIDQTYAAAPVSNGTITAFVNGSPTITTFNVGASGTLFTSGGISSLDISGDNNSTGIENIDLTADKAGTIITGTYSVNSTTMAATGQYDNPGGASFFALFMGTPQINPLTIIISNITTSPNRVTGTFFGTMKDNTGVGPGTVAFSNGTFDVSY